MSLSVPASHAPRRTGWLSWPARHPDRGRASSRKSGALGFAYSSRERHKNATHPVGEGRARYGEHGMAILGAAPSSRRPVDAITNSVKRTRRTSSNTSQPARSTITLSVISGRRKWRPSAISRPVTAAAVMRSTKPYQGVGSKRPPPGAGRPPERSARPAPTTSRGLILHWQQLLPGMGAV